VRIPDPPFHKEQALVALQHALAAAQERENQRLAFAGGYYLHFGEYLAGFLTAAAGLAFDPGLVHGSYRRGHGDGTAYREGRLVVELTGGGGG
jgi:hypothetical protein